MKKNRSILFGLVVGVSALAFSSCAYDPYATAGYGGGYGDGYGYGGSGFSTSYFVRTGSSRWAYDPYAGAYYDYTVRRYYDPYLSGYYPVGYRPRYVHGSPHPHGWSRGSSYCPPPRSVRNHYLKDYHNRGERYRNLGRSWSNDVRVNSGGRDQRSRYGDRDQRSRYGNQDQRSRYGDRDQRSSFGDRERASRMEQIQRSSRQDRSGRTVPVFNGSAETGDRRSIDPRRNYSGQPEVRSRSRGSEDRASRSGSYGRTQSTPSFSPPSRDVRSEARQMQRGVGRPESSGRERSFDRGRGEKSRGEANDAEKSRGDADRSGRGRIRGLGEG